ncbi:MAG: hypothetical protein JHD28_11210 [Bacteroidia bacterium]|nr:hypothetical protein [Bacteroidia bacterium]
MNNNFLIAAYSVYLPVTLFLTYYVAKTLFNSGKIFMLDIFKGRVEIAESTNHLFRVGFYLLNIGFAMLMLKTNYEVFNGQTLLEVLSLKVGGFSIYLGLMLFFNLYLFFRGKRKSKENQALENA